MSWGITGWSTGNSTPLNYRLRAGQFRSRFSSPIVNKNIIINQQYNYGNCCQGGYAFQGYDYGCQHDCGGDIPKWTKWLIGFGAAGTILGNILGLCKPNEITTETLDENTELPSQIDTSKQTIDESAVTQAPVQPSQDDQATPEAQSTIKFEVGELMNCIDDALNIEDIHGKFTDIKRNKDNSISGFTIIDENSNNKYEFEYVSDSSDGKPQFKCTKKNNLNVVGTQIYVLEEDGQLKQHEGMDGYGIGIKTQ